MKRREEKRGEEGRGGEGRRMEGVQLEIIDHKKCCELNKVKHNKIS